MQYTKKNPISPTRHVYRAGGTSLDLKEIYHQIFGIPAISSITIYRRHYYETLLNLSMLHPAAIKGITDALKAFLDPKQSNTEVAA